MPMFHVDSDAVAHTSSTASASITRIQAEVAALHSQLSNLQGSWTGAAASAFQAVVSEWHLTAQRVDENLTSIQQALTHAANTYQDIEAATARMFRG
jgi:early secretory antigenic target protein ESAT-6